MLLQPATVRCFAVRGLLVAVINVVALSFHVAAEVPPPAATVTPDLRDRILDAVDRLGSPDPAERETASKFLASVSREAEPILSDAVKGDDAEVAARARLLLRRMHAGVNAETPRETVDRVAEYEDAGDSDAKLAAANKLLHTPDALPILIRLWASEPNIVIRTEVGQLFQGQSRKYIPQLLAADAEDALLTLLENDAPLGEPATLDYLTALILTNKLDDAVARLGAPETATSPIAGWLFLAKGNIDAARRVAELKNDDRLLRAIQFQTGDWKSLAAFYEDAANRPAAPANALHLSAAFHWMAGDAKALAADLDRIGKSIQDQSGPPVFAAAEVFLLVGQVERGIAILKPQFPSSAFELLCERMHFAEGFALLDAPPRDAVARFSLDATAARWYHRLGRDEDASRLLTDADKALDEQPEPRIRSGAIAGIAWSLGMKDRAIKIIEKIADPKATANAVGDLFVGRRSEAELFWPILQKSKPGSSTLEQLTAMDDLLSGRSSEEAVRVLGDAARKAALLTGPIDSSRQMVWIARLLAEYGISDAAEACLQRVPAQAAAADGYLTLADRAVKDQRWPDAARLYGIAADLSSDAPVGLYLQGVALSHSGSTEDGAALIRRARLLPLAGEERGNLTRALLQRKMHAEADEESQLLLKMPGLPSRSASEASQRRSKILAETGDFIGAIDLLDRGMLQVFQNEGTYANESAYLDFPRQRQMLRARALIARNQVDEAAPLLRDAADRYPADVDWTIRMVQSLEKSPATKPLAEELFAKSLQQHRTLFETYPDASSFHNGIAWLCARTGRQLDDALKHAEQAVAADPQNSAYLDTLAETHFRRGENARAVELAKKCVELVPRSDYFKNNVKRFAGSTSEPQPQPDDSDEEDAD